MVLVCAGVLFYRVEQGAVERSKLSVAHVSSTNAALRKANEQLEAAKKNLEEDEQECVEAMGDGAEK